MSDTKRRKAWNLFRRERKPFRKAHFRAYRHRMNILTKSVDTAQAVQPYVKTQGWLTW